MLLNNIVNLLALFFVGNAIRGEPHFNETSTDQQDTRNALGFLAITGPIGIAVYAAAVGYFLVSYDWENKKSGYTHVLVNKMKDNVYNGKESIGINESIAVKYSSDYNKPTGVCIQADNKNYWVLFPKKPCCSDSWFPAIEEVDGRPWFVLYHRKDKTNYFEKILNCKMGTMVASCSDKIKDSVIQEMYDGMEYRCQAAADGGHHSREFDGTEELDGNEISGDL